MTRMAGGGLGGEGSFWGGILHQKRCFIVLSLLSCCCLYLCFPAGMPGLSLWFDLAIWFDLPSSVLSVCCCCRCWIIPVRYPFGQPRPSCAACQSLNSL